ncbi:EF-hand domain-containing protein [Novosphingobium panipatense]|uniref:EF hand n=1 Tax=Novosphingobium panipatense TaxID=428991 RepID=A0ABY1QF26_9SPHN|nr:EF-hand domain-containing protein [Novosphingobium panipatense]SMP69501.1 EF hand [Novosphingobium panipatense]
MTRMKTLMLGLSAAALTIGGVAGAQAQTPAEKPRMERPTMDANGDGVTSRAEAQAAAAQMFAKFDANKDGKLDKADRELARQQGRERAFDRLDTNDDGSISQTEFTAERSRDRGDRPASGMTRPTSQNEAGQAPHHGGKHKRGHHGSGGMRGGMTMMQQADTNKDGALSQAEFTAAALQRFDAQDANRDGNVTKEERQAHREKMRAEWQAKRADKKAVN